MCERNMITQVEKLKAARPQVKGWVRLRCPPPTVRLQLDRHCSLV
jgi:hypothetical protein